MKKIKFIQFDQITFNNIYQSLFHLIDLSRDTDENGAILSIKKNISFRGANLWVLAFSIIIASVGLNVNSTAVIIGAMLISPLMGPILGIGLGVGTNDFETIITSIKNLSVAIIISLITSWLYFLISPLSDAQSELLARTNPTIYDVLIAFFGGLAGIIGASRLEKSNIIPGVAIATALMPPLCTAGYGLAIGDFSFFIGAFYLFFINSVFICLGTYLIVRYLKFPKVKFLDEKKEKKVKSFILIFSILTVIPSLVIGWNVVNESYFNSKVQKFINENLVFDNTKVISSSFQYLPSQKIEVSMIGEPLSKEYQEKLKLKLDDYGLEDTKLIIYQDASSEKRLSDKVNKDVRIGIIEDLYKINEQVIKNKDKKIALLEAEVIKYQSINKSGSELIDEVKIHYPNIINISYSIGINNNFITSQVDTLPILNVKWSKLPTKSEQLKMYSWIKLRLKSDSLYIIHTSH